MLALLHHWTGLERATSGSRKVLWNCITAIASGYLAGYTFGRRGKGMRVSDIIALRNRLICSMEIQTPWICMGVQRHENKTSFALTEELPRMLPVFNMLTIKDNVDWFNFTKGRIGSNANSYEFSISNFLTFFWRSVTNSNDRSRKGFRIL